MKTVVLQLPSPWIDYSSQGYARSKKTAVPEASSYGFVLVGLCALLVIYLKTKRIK